jgi:hypothetical protein
LFDEEHQPEELVSNLRCNCYLGLIKHTNLPLTLENEEDEESKIVTGLRRVADMVKEAEMIV